jgi:hypothetical protein
VLTGLVAGKPIWAADGKIEAGLKAFFGALLSLGAMFALRRWVSLPVDLSALRAGSGTLGDLPAAALPMIAAALSAFYELDNTGADDGKADGASGAGAKPGAATGGKGAKVRVQPDEPEADDEEREESLANKKRRR